MTVRAIERADADAWLDLRVALWPEGSRSEHEGEIERYFAGQASEPQAVLVATSDDGHLVGFAELSIRNYAEGCSTTRVAYLEGWYVVPDARRSGVGRALVKAAEEWGRREGCAELASDTQADNDVSRMAHRAVGFSETGLIRCFCKGI